MKEFIRTVKFMLISASAAIVQMSSFALLYEVIGLTYWIAYLISLVLSVVWNFTINRKATFKSDVNYGIAMLKELGYYAVFTPLSTFGGQALESAGWNGFLVEVISMLVNFVTEFLFMRFVVFRGKIDTAEKKTDKTEEEKTAE